jgi:hypothetical protein
MKPKGTLSGGLTSFLCRILASRTLWYFTYNSFFLMPCWVCCPPSRKTCPRGRCILNPFSQTVQENELLQPTMQDRQFLRVRIAH